MKNKLAIIIPYYKIDFFEQTLQSISKQTDKRFSLYIGNDASPDDPIQLIQSYLENDTYQYFEYKENLGGKNLAMQWERVLENVTEDWFQILGDDDMIAENFVEEFYKNISNIYKKESKVIRIPHQQINEKGDVLKDLLEQDRIINATDFFVSLYKGESSGTLSENIFNRNIYKQKRFHKIPLAWGADHLAILDFANNQPIYYLVNTKVLVRIFSNSISGSTSNILQKIDAYNTFRETIVSNYNNQFDYYFILSVFKEYRAYKEKYNHYINKQIILSFLKLKKTTISLSIIRYNFRVNKFLRKKKKYLSSYKYYTYKADRYIKTFLSTETKYDSTRQNNVDEVIYCFWTGDNEMNTNRKEAIKTIEKNVNVKVKLITKDNLQKYVLPNFPLHESYNYLSDVHKSDYLRCYFMHHYGGGYTDIKAHDKSWSNAFFQLNKNKDAFAIGYREINAKGVGYVDLFYEEENVKFLNRDMEKHFFYLLGNCSYIFRPYTSFTYEWITELHRRLDILSKDLKENSGNVMGDNEGYPIAWTAILGQIFHPLCLKYHSHLLINEDLKPNLINYR